MKKITIPVLLTTLLVACGSMSAITPTTPPPPTSTPLPVGSDPLTEYRLEDLRDEILQVHNGWEEWAPVEYLQKLQRETGVRFRICIQRDGCRFYARGLGVGELRPVGGAKAAYLQYVQVEPNPKEDGYLKVLINPLYRWWVNGVHGGEFIRLGEGWEEP